MTAPRRDRAFLHFYMSHLVGLQFEPRTWEPTRPDWDHDHCEICYREISACRPSECGDRVSDHGYVSEHGNWICDVCFPEYRVDMGWGVRGPG